MALRPAPKRQGTHGDAIHVPPSGARKLGSRGPITGHGQAGTTHVPIAQLGSANDWYKLCGQGLRLDGWMAALLRRSRLGGRV